MSDSQEHQTIDPQELAHRKRCINDFKRFTPHIPEHLQATLNENMAEAGRSALLEVLILAVQAGRLLQLEDNNTEWARALVARENKLAQKQPQPSSLLKGLLDVNGRELRKQQKELETIDPSAKPVDILVAPGFALPTKH